MDDCCAACCGAICATVEIAFQTSCYFCTTGRGSGRGRHSRGWFSNETPRRKKKAGHVTTQPEPTAPPAIPDTTAATGLPKNASDSKPDPVSQPTAKNDAYPTLKPMSDPEPTKTSSATSGLATKKEPVADSSPPPDAEATQSTDQGRQTE